FSLSRSASGGGGGGGGRVGWAGALLAWGAVPEVTRTQKELPHRGQVRQSAPVRKPVGKTWVQVGLGQGKALEAAGAPPYGARMRCGSGSPRLAVLRPGACCSRLNPWRSGTERIAAHLGHRVCLPAALSGAWPVFPHSGQITVMGMGGAKNEDSALS